MNVGIIIAWMTCLFAVALTMGGPIRRQTSQSEKTVPIRGNVTFLCPFVPDLTWQYVYWKKNDQTIYSLEVQSDTPTTNDARYEGSNHATRFTIKDLKKTDSGIYHCKVATLATADFIKEGGQVLLSVTDQEGGLFTTSPGFPLRTSTSMPPKHPEDNTFYLAFSITLSILINIIIIITTMGLVVKYRKQILNSKLVKACQRRAPTTDSTPVPADSTPMLDARYLEKLEAPTTDSTQQVTADSTPLLDARYLEKLEAPTTDSTQQVTVAPNLDNPEEGTRTPLLPSNGTDDMGRLGKSSDDSQAFTTETREPQVPLVGRLLIDDLRRATKGEGKQLFMCRMRKVLHTILKLNEGEDAPPGVGKYSFLEKYVWCIPGCVLADVKYCLDELNHIPVGRKRDVYEILLTMPENQQEDKSTFHSKSNKDILKEYDQDDQGNAIKYEEESRSETLRDQMRMILETKSETRDGARNKISMIILNAPVVSASLNQQAASRLNQSASKTEQVLSVSFKLSDRHTDLERMDNNLIQFWLSIVIKLRPEVQRVDVIGQFDDYLEKAMGRPDTKNADAKDEKNINLNDSTHLESQRRKSECPPETNATLPSKEQKKIIFKQPPAEISSNRATGLKDEIQNKLHTKNILNVDATKEN